MSANTTSTLEYLDPTNPPGSQSLFVPRVGSLRGSRIAFVDNGWSSFTRMGERIRQLLASRHAIAGMRAYEIPSSAVIPPETLERVVAESDAAIVGMAN